MPPAKRSPSSSSKSSPPARPAAARTTAAKTRPSAATTRSSAATTRSSAAKTRTAGAKGTATTARKASGRTATQAKSGATRTSRTASARANETARAARAGTKATAKAAGAAAAETAKSARSGAKGTATAARGGARATASRAKAANTATKRASDGDGVVASTIKGALHPSETVTLSRDKIQETLDEAAARGRVTRKDADSLVAELMRRGRGAGDDVREEVGDLLGKGVHRIESATRKVRRAEPVDRLVRGADRARRAAGVGPAFPIIGYDELNVIQVQSRIKELSKPDQRKVLTYERRNANRKSVVGALEKSLG